MQPDARSIRSLRRRDPLLAAAMDRTPAFPGFPSGERRRVSRYESIAKAIVFQQLAGKAAATIWGRVRALGPNGRLPAPPDLLELPDEALRSAGLSRAKLAALRDLAERLDDGRLVLRSIHRLDDDEIIETLVQVRGIGPWTAQMFLLFQLGRLDVMPSTDLGVQEGLRLLESRAERPGPAELLARAEVWGPLRSVASWHLWRLTELPPETLKELAQSS
jgi:DNA-3-methyladenine glycosylase II